MIHAKKSGHPGGSLGVTDLLVCLYFEIMDHNKDFKMDGKMKIYFSYPLVTLLLHGIVF